MLVSQGHNSSLGPSLSRRTQLARVLPSPACLPRRAKPKVDKEASLEQLRLAASRHGYSRETANLPSGPRPNVCLALPPPADSCTTSRVLAAAGARRDLAGAGAMEPRWGSPFATSVAPGISAFLRQAWRAEGNGARFAGCTAGLGAPKDWKGPMTSLYRPPLALLCSI